MGKEFDQEKRNKILDVLSSVWLTSLKSQSNREMVADLITKELFGDPNGHLNNTSYGNDPIVATSDPNWDHDKYRQPATESKNVGRPIQIETGETPVSSKTILSTDNESEKVIDDIKVAPKVSAEVKVKKVKKTGIPKNIQTRAKKEAIKNRDQKLSNKDKAKMRQRQEIEKMKKKTQPKPKKVLKNPFIQEKQENDIDR